MRKKYQKPEIKVVKFMVEAGYNDSVFRTSQHELFNNQSMQTERLSHQQTSGQDQHFFIR